MTQCIEQRISSPIPTKLQKMWLEDRHCRCCGHPTRLLWLKDGMMPDDAATIEHKYPRGHIHRKKAKHVQLLYCWGCNQASNKFFLATGEIYSYHKSYEYQQLLSKYMAAKNTGRYTIPKKRALIPLECCTFVSAVKPNTSNTVKPDPLLDSQGKSGRIEVLRQTAGRLLAPLRGWVEIFKTWI